jgi:hypothetical protein
MGSVILGIGFWVEENVTCGGAHHSLVGAQTDLQLT